MQPPDHLLAAFTLFGSQYPTWKVTDGTLRAWALLTSDVDPEAFMSAAIQFCRTSKWPPTVAEIRAIARGPAEPTAEEAWEILYTRQSPPNESAQRALRAIGGWSAMKSMPSSGLPTIRAQFLRCYDAFLGRERDDEERAGAESLAEFNKRDLDEIDAQELRQLESE